MYKMSQYPQIFCPHCRNNKAHVLGGLFLWGVDILGIKDYEVIDTSLSENTGGHIAIDICCSFTVIAIVTRSCKIVNVVCTSFRYRLDMIYHQPVAINSSLTTIIATEFIPA